MQPQQPTEKRARVRQSRQEVVLMRAICTRCAAVLWQLPTESFHSWVARVVLFEEEHAHAEPAAPSAGNDGMAWS